jgi:hypothetical protein
MSGTPGIGNATTAQLAMPSRVPAVQFHKLSGVKSSRAATSTDALGDLGQSSASFSPLGSLLSNLQQLQAQNPAQFNQVVTQIAGQLQAAAQQQGQTPAGQFLATLADKFQNIANGGDLSQLQPQHHHHHAHRAYTGNQTDSLAAGASVSSPTTDAQASGSGSNLQQLFASISQEVSQALSRA